MSKGGKGRGLEPKPSQPQDINQSNKPLCNAAIGMAESSDIVMLGYKAFTKLGGILKNSNNLGQIIVVFKTTYI
jgi:hypothetical protein